MTRASGSKTHGEVPEMGRAGLGIAWCESTPQTEVQALCQALAAAGVRCKPSATPASAQAWVLMVTEGDATTVSCLPRLVRDANGQVLVVMAGAGPLRAERLWRQMLPDRTPVSPDVDYSELAARFEFTGGQIKNSVFRAAARAALRTQANRLITMGDLVLAAQEESTGEPDKPVGFGPR